MRLRCVENDVGSRVRRKWLQHHQRGRGRGCGRRESEKLDQILTFILASSQKISIHILNNSLMLSARIEIASMDLVLNFSSAFCVTGFGFKKF